MADIRELLYEDWMEDSGYPTDYDELIATLDENEIEYAEYSTFGVEDGDVIDIVSVYDIDGDECAIFYFVSGTLVRFEDLNN